MKQLSCYLITQVIKSPSNEPNNHWSEKLRNQLELQQELPSNRQMRILLIPSIHIVVIAYIFQLWLPQSPTTYVKREGWIEYRNSNNHPPIHPVQSVHSFSLIPREIKKLFIMHYNTIHYVTRYINEGRRRRCLSIRLP